ncbi:hypothetical protein [Allosphingosinicella indica]|uniref:Uncharacterized protein n=1 Tax=Allosphingosinicella indica TaxID=941907 RepID=A0A1X7GDH2_9SPHN|nr:hypothetical protein [Allosphingosinicella indica]SMF68068.1 hypothetical protein SAMN06295910_1582 [Allosphingosinicella indica]
MNAKEQMQMIDAELARIRSEIERLRAQEEVLLKLRSSFSGEPAAVARKRSSPVKPLVIDIMRSVGFAGATSAEVDDMVREKVPTVAKDSVGSILSRLKSAGALVYSGERYYEKQFAPKAESPFEQGLRAVG